MGGSFWIGVGRGRRGIIPPAADRHSLLNPPLRTRASYFPTKVRSTLDIQVGPASWACKLDLQAGHPIGPFRVRHHENREEIMRKVLGSAFCFSNGNCAAFDERPGL